MTWRTVPHKRAPHRLTTLVQGLTERTIGTSAISTGDEEVFVILRAWLWLAQMGTEEWVALISAAEDHALSVSGAVHRTFISSIKTFVMQRRI